MASGRLEYDAVAVGSLWQDLTTIKSEFDSANSDSTDIAEAVGHHGLADKIRDFATKWDDMRGDLSDQIKDLAAAALKLNSEFDKTETELVSMLAGKKD